MFCKFLENEKGGGGLEFSLIGFLVAFCVVVILFQFL